MLGWRVAPGREAPAEGERRMAEPDKTLPSPTPLRAGVQVEVARPHIRFRGGPHDGLHRWPDYTAFIEPTLKPWERQAIYELWVRALETQRAVPLWAQPATPAPDLPAP
jgi:hypothetical protein